MRCDPALLDHAGVSVAGHPDRAGSGVTSGYVFGERFVITCDPAAEEMLAAAVADMEPTLTGWSAVANSCGGEFLGAGRMSLHESDEIAMPSLPDGFGWQTLLRDQDASLALIKNLIAVSSEDDLEEAELAIDDLDDIMEGIIAPSGEIAAYGSSRPFDLVEGYGDIGVITHGEYRRSRLGAAVVQAVCVRLQGSGIEPLYRCDEANVASSQLSESMGFIPVTRLQAYRFGH